MGLSKKNFLYSICISLLLISLVTGYFVLMLPALYAAHMNEINYQSIVALHQSFMEKGSYEGAEVRNPTGCVSIVIPKYKNEIVVHGMNYQVKLTIHDQELLEITNLIGNIAKLSGEEITALWTKIEQSEAVKELLKQINEDENASFTIELETDAQEMFTEMSTDMKVHRVNDHLFVWESIASDSYNQYMNYIAMETQPDGITMTTLPVMAPKINEIRPVVMGSLPMIIVVVFLLVLLVSQLYSGKIVNPIIKISNYAETAMQISDFEMDKLEINSKDEIGILADSINEMYSKLALSYKELMKKNELLEDENKRQEVFLRASSHQLKTPIAAALLLTEGMLGEVGKFKDTKEYLPQVKNQLLSMKNIVDDILYLNAGIGDIKREEVNVMKLVNDLIENYQVQIKNKQLELLIHPDEMVINSDGDLLCKILDNVISNAVLHTEIANKIEIMGQSQSLVIRNYGSHISEEILPHIYEPFVSGTTQDKGHGLGLYVTAYYTKLLGYEIQISNEEEAVKTVIYFGGNDKC